MALLTEAAKGMGLAVAWAFAQSGTVAAMTDIDVDAVGKEARVLVKAGDKALAISCDVTDEAQVRDMTAATIREFGRLDAAFNNAGIRRPCNGYSRVGARGI